MLLGFVVENSVKRPIYRKLPTSGIIGSTHVCTGRALFILDDRLSSLLSGDAVGWGGELP